MTYLEAVNKILRGLRENEVESVDSSSEEYVGLVGQTLNEALEDIQDMGPWYALRTTINKTLSASTSTLDLTAETNDKSYLLYSNNQPQAWVVTDNEEHRLQVIEQGQMDGLRAVNPDADENVPYAVSFNKSNDGLTAEFWPTPDSGYDVRFVIVVPQPDMDDDLDEIAIPAGPVWREALIRLMDERGEEFSSSLERKESSAARALDAAVLNDFGRDNMTFEPV